MNITPIIPDAYNGPIKQLTCHICKHLFYITQDDYRRLQEVRYCHECSLILLEELRNNQGAAALHAPTTKRLIPELVLVAKSISSSSEQSAKKWS